MNLGDDQEHGVVVFSPVHSHEVEIDCHQAQQVAYGDRAIAGDISRARLQDPKCGVKL